ncbi:glycosyltransferase [Hwanghaeella grinnelliae]|uniref:Glycosyltransferase n=1 Tax=Hwanghaeella grinnelliae TaxID=2500179 RepID=A0A3S2ZD03_9PROT|nr:glycosyltransferase [Hwanghaeella grinnelliae]
MRLQVVIPTLNAATTLSAAVAALRAGKTGMTVDILICDGGSVDATTKAAEALGLRVVRSEKGRGRQLRAGAKAALLDGDPDLLLFLHADSTLQPGWEEAVVGFAARADRDEKACYFQFALDDAAPAARRLERLVAWRCRTFGLPYGDQGLLLTPALYRKLGGFNSLPLMEDVEIVQRIGRDNMFPLTASLETSAQRYRQSGYLRRSLRNLICLSLYFLGVPPHVLARLYG